MRNALLSLSTCALCALAASQVRADLGLTEATTLLASSDHDQVEAGIQGLGLLGTADAVPPLSARIRAGLPPDLLDTAIVTLGAIGDAQAAPVLLELASHRRPEIRARAIEVLATLAPPGAEEALRAALSDGDAKVRSAAATGLGELEATASVERLFTALDHGNLEASVAIGKALRPNQVSQLAGYLGKIPFRSLGPALAEVLARKDVAERDKLAVLARLQEIGTPEVKTYLGDFLRNAGEAITPALRRAILQAMQGIAK